MLNLKAYPGALGAAGLRLGMTLQRLGHDAGVAVALAPSAPDLGWFARELDIPVVAQHTDSVDAGASTGWTVPEALKADGVRGSLVNHSEHPLSPAAIRATVGRLGMVGLVPIVCAGDVRSAGNLVKLRPPFLAIEPPELIGGRRSVSTARPEAISETVDLARRFSPSTHVLCGAGVHDREDVRRALELGSEGILVASAVALSSDPSRAISELLTGF